MPTLGDTIRKLRKKAAVSQFMLENLIGASNGSISRIENGKVNPTKETLADIAFALKLRPHQIASLYGINNYSPLEIINSLSKLINAKTIDEFSQQVIDNLVFKLGYIASAFFIVDSNTIQTKAITRNNISEVTFRLLGKRPLDQIRWDINSEQQSALVRAALSQKPVVVDRSSDYLCPTIPKQLADKIQKQSGDVNTLIYPITSKNNTIALLVLASKVKTDFKDDTEIIKSVVEQIALVLDTLDFEVMT